MTLLLIIDNYDSFVYNIVDLAARIGARSIVVRNDEVTVRGVERINPDGIIISPGPGNPENPRDVGVSRDVVSELAVGSRAAGQHGVQFVFRDLAGEAWQKAFRHARSDSPFRLTTSRREDRVRDESFERLAMGGGHAAEDQADIR